MAGNASRPARARRTAGAVVIDRRDARNRELVAELGDSRVVPADEAAQHLESLGVSPEQARKLTGLRYETPPAEE